MTDRKFGRLRGLSDAQIALLAEISNGAMTEVGAMLTSGRGWRKTVARLVDDGLVVFQPYAAKRAGAYKLTADGRARVDTLKKTGDIVEEKP